MIIDWIIAAIITRFVIKKLLKRYARLPNTNSHSKSDYRTKNKQRFNKPPVPTRTLSPVQKVEKVHL
jgi:hypothetical protein